MNPMRPAPLRRRSTFAAAALAAVVVLLGADDPKTKNVDARGLSFQAPESWKQVQASQMRAAQLRVDPIEGDAYPAELVVFVFPGGAGTVNDNLARWEKMFKDDKGQSPRIESKKVQAKGGIEATRAETSGLYHPTAFPGRPAEPDRPDARLLGAIVTTDDAGYFLRMIGPDKTMKALTPQFDDLVKSLELKSK